MGIPAAAGKPASVAAVGLNGDWPMDAICENGFDIIPCPKQRGKNTRTSLLIISLKIKITKYTKKKIIL